MEGHGRWETENPSSYPERRSDGSILCLVSSDTSLDACEVALAYGWRWEIEVAIKGLKQRLGLGQYQCRYYEGTVHHLHLSLLAQLVLTTAELKRGHYACKKYATLQFPSIRNLQNHLRLEVQREFLKRIKAQCLDANLIRRLEAALAAA
ncbi:MAG: transposase [Candidatus Latescibacterota bacterium]